MQKTHRIKPNDFLRIILVVVCICTASVFMYKSVIDKISYNRDATTEAFKEEQFKVIWSSLEALYIQAETEVTEISESIEDNILDLSDDQLLKLQQDLTNDTLNQDLHKILNSNMEGKNLNGISNHMNSIVVMTTDGFIEDYNYNRAVETNGSSVRSWELAIDNSYNKELEQDAINKLLNRNSGIIALESYNLTKDDNHIKINELTYESLLEVYLEEGINGLRNYQIFVPYYITDFGDIFGTPDIIHGSKVDNNKLIVVQEFNLYDQVMYKQYNLFNDEQVKEINARYNDLLRLSYVLGITLVTSVIALIIYLCNMYNTLLVDEEEETLIDNNKDVENK